MDQPIKVEVTDEQWVELGKVLRHQRTIDRKNKKDFGKTLDGIFSRLRAGQEITRDQLAYIHRSAERMGVPITLPTVAAFATTAPEDGEDEVPVDPLDAVMVKLGKIESRLRYLGNAVEAMSKVLTEISEKFDEGAINQWQDLLPPEERR